MDVSRVSTSQAQGGQGQHRHLSIGDRINNLESIIADAVKSGKVSDDQGTQMKTALDDISKMLSQKQTDSTGQTDRSTQSASDRQKARAQLRDVAKRLFAALDPQGAAAGAAAAGPLAPGAHSDQMFKAMDADGDGKIGRDEWSSSVNTTTGTRQDGNGLFSSYDHQGSQTITLSARQSQFSVTA